MNFEEHAAKSLVLTPAGIPVPRGTLCISAAEAAMAAANIGPCVVKAQVPAGKRGKAGGIKLAAGPDEAKQAASQILGMRIGEFTVERVLVEEQAEIAREFYAAVLHDVAARKPLILFSTEGGMDIEEIAAAKPSAIRRLLVDIDGRPSAADIATMLEVSVSAGGRADRANLDRMPLLRAMPSFLRLIPWPCSRTIAWLHSTANSCSTMPRSIASRTSRSRVLPPQ
jgi:succinyl-CoA synthetase beta subunit